MLDRGLPLTLFLLDLTTILGGIYPFFFVELRFLTWSQYCPIVFIFFIQFFRCFIMAIQALTEKSNGLTTAGKLSRPHPLARLASLEIDVARQVVTKARSGHLLLFRDIFTEEPAKAELVPFLEAEHSGQLTEETSRPPRLARVQYDQIGDDGSHAYTESVIDVIARHEVLYRVVDKDVQPPLTLLVNYST